MFKNVIKKTVDNEVVFLIDFNATKPNGLDAFTSIEVTIGSESYNTVDNPTNVLVDGNRIILRIGDTTALPAGKYYPKIKGYDEGVYNDGYTFTSGDFNPINKLEVI